MQCRGARWSSGASRGYALEEEEEVNNELNTHKTGPRSMGPVLCVFFKSGAKRFFDELIIYSKLINNILIEAGLLHREKTRFAMPIARLGSLALPSLRSS